MQGDMFGDVPDAPKEPEIGSKFRSLVGQVTEQARAAMHERQRQEAIEAEAAAEEAARLAHLAEAAEALDQITPDDPDRFLPEEDADELPSNVVPLRRKRAPKADGRGDFFAIDQRLWDRVCSLGLNPAVAYLVIARGTGGDNLTSSWSVNAIETHAGMGRIRAKAAVDALVAAGLVYRSWAGKAPRYRLAVFDAVAAERRVKGELASEYLVILKRIAALGEEAASHKIPAARGVDAGWPAPNPRRLAEELAGAGYLRAGYAAGAYVLTDHGNKALAPRWVWLPNSIVDGAAGEPSPLERIRQSQFLPALRLFVDMYQEQEITEVAGVNWRHGVREDFNKHRVGARGLYVIWGFSSKQDVTWRSAPLAKPHLDNDKEEGQKLEAFWKALRILRNSSLIESVPHLVEAETATAEVLHPMPRTNGHPAELAITAAADRAARSMVSEAQIRNAELMGFSYFVPVAAGTEDVALVGIYRLRYRAKTNAARVWLENQADWEDWAARYATMTVERGGEEHATSRGNQG